MTILLATRLDAADEARWLALLRSALPGETITARRTDIGDAGVDVAIVANPRPGALTGLPRLALIQSLWAGVETLLSDPQLPADVPLARMVDPAMSAAMAETALWAVLALQRDFLDYAAQQRERRWHPLPQRRADEFPVAVLGLGQMGRAVAVRLAANGFPVHGWSRTAVDVPGVKTDHGDAALPRMLGGGRVVINLLPLTPATRNLFDAARFAQMAHGAAFVNLARGAQVVDADLIAALESGRVQRAVLDVFRAEPLSPEHPFWVHPRITVLPHSAAQTDARSAAAIAARNVLALRAGRPLEHLVDRARGY
jgi:glyoxylate/hydroxypyruvate reductase A